ncbi:MAG: hypothetical protein JW716_02130 [Candidatus Aenigmarchaeota archaeon]|nr:hypothetical protein [Candidatus Aenigmarchaeota archaeon]
MGEDELEIGVPEEFEEDKVEITDMQEADVLDSKSMGKLKKILEKNKNLILRMRKENQVLSRKVKMIAENNSEFAGLVEILESEIQSLTDNVSDKYRYSFEDGGWVEKGTGRKAVLEEVFKNPDINVINAQLEEILRLVKLHKKRIKKK